MKDKTKSMIQLSLGMLKETLKSQGVLMGAQVNKKDPEKTKLVFLDKAKYMNGENDGFTIDFNEMNSYESEEKK